MVEIDATTLFAIIGEYEVGRRMHEKVMQDVQRELAAIREQLTPPPEPPQAVSDA